MVTGPFRTVGELAEAISGSACDLVIDGTAWPVHTELRSTGIGHGSVVGGRVTDRESAWSLQVESGLAVGTTVPLQVGSRQIGRQDIPDSTVSVSHFTLERYNDGVRVADRGATNGTFVDGARVGADWHEVQPGSVITAGAAGIALVVPLRSSGRHPLERPHHRPPRRPLPPPTPALNLPGTAALVSSPTRFSWAAFLAPLVLGLGMAALFDWRMAAFALLSPLLGIGTWIEDRRRVHRDRRAAVSHDDQALARFRLELADAMRRERSRRAALLPGAAACVKRVRTGDPAIWERRVDDADFLVLSLGRGRVRWKPEVTRPPGAEVLVPALHEAETSVIDDCPVGVRLSAGEVVGICGEPEGGSALARSLVLQAAVLHGPADLAITVVTGASSEADWDWIKWLPHHDPDPGMGPPDVLALAVIDSRDLHTSLSRPPGAAIVVALTRDHLPAWCTQIVSVNGPVAEVDCVSEADAIAEVVVDGVPLAVAEGLARDLAPLIDPEARSPHGTGVNLLDVVDFPSGRALSTPGVSRLRAVLGRACEEDYAVDLVADGPHALIAGTTGSGKSELLRTMVASLGATYSPSQVTFFLIDYKGGSAFDAVASLPHVVGMLTDLGGELGERALASLEAEVRHRERRLRAAGLTDLTAWPHGTEDAMPRLVVVIDEFAALHRDLPGFIDSLVQIAQRGRSLGLHLVLATQRPQGVVSDAIRANTNIRICLRVQDGAESHDVIGSSDAAALSRPGAALARIGLEEVTPFQVAFSSAPVGQRSQVRPFHRRALAEHRHPEEGPTQLTQLIEAITAAWRDIPAPRRPWLPPLPVQLDLSTLPAGAVALADDPANQRQEPWVWPSGPIQLYGVTGSGTTTALVSLALGAARQSCPDGLNIYALDFGSGGLHDLADLPHTGAVIGGGDVERVVKCIDWLHEEVRRRRSDPVACGPRILVLVDGWGSFASAFDTLDGLAVRERLMKVVVEGAGVGVDVALAGESPIAIPASLAMAVPGKLVFRLADRHDYAALGVASREPIATPGRCVDAATGLTMQVALPSPAAFEEALRWPSARRAQQGIEALPTEVKLADVTAAEATTGTRISLTVGVGHDGVSPVSIDLGPSDHVLVVGQRGSGRSTVLETIATAMSREHPEVPVIAVAPATSPLATSVGVDRWLDAADNAAVGSAMNELLGTGRPVVLLVDDAERCLQHEAFVALLERGDSHIHVVAATRPEPLRSYSGWLQQLRGGTMLVLQPANIPDADVVSGVPFPRRPFLPNVPGRGELVRDGVVELVQVAVP